MTFDDSSATPSSSVDSLSTVTGSPATGYVVGPANDVIVRQAANTYVCVKTTKPGSGLVGFAPSYWDSSTNEWESHWILQAYSMKSARFLNGTYTTQLEQCVVGGSRNKSWHRLAKSEFNLSIGANTTKLIGYKWGSGSDNGTVSSTLSFNVPVTKASSISASLPVSNGGNFDGSIGAGTCGSIGSASGNQVNTGWYYTYPGFGTSKFKGNVGHGLYEWLTPNKKNFVIVGQFCRVRRYF